MRSLLELGTLYDIMPGTPGYDSETVCAICVGNGKRGFSGNGLQDKVRCMKEGDAAVSY